jgi:hypothetical protein
LYPTDFGQTDSEHKKHAVSTTTTTTTTVAAAIIIVIITKCYSWEREFLVPYFITTKWLQNYIPRNMVCFRYIIVNKLYKGDK